MTTGPAKRRRRNPKVNLVEKIPSSGGTPVPDFWPRRFKKLVVFGESTAAGGWSSTPDRSWARVLAGLISDFQDDPPHLINSGIGGNLISNRGPGYPYSAKPAAVERVDKHVNDHEPDLLVISYGLNDARAGTPVEMFREEMIRLIGAVRQRCDPLIVLLGPYFMTDFKAGNERFTSGSHELFELFNLVVYQVASQLDCLFCDVYRAYNGAPWLVHYDGVHPNDLGHRIIGNAIFTTLAQNCSGLAIRTAQLERSSPRWRDESMLQADYGY